MSRQQETQVHKHFLREYKALLTAHSVELTTKKGSKKVMVDFALDGITSLDLSEV